MDEAAARTGTGPTASRGRIDKRAAILDAAFTVFAREGYAQAGMDVIAVEAGVAKATVYNHFGDKETLLRQAFVAESDRALARNLAAVEQLAGRLAGQQAELRPMLEDFGFSLATCYCDERATALRRLLAAESGQFPELLDLVHKVTDRVLQALADRLARLSLAGSLRTAEPLTAAEQFSALLTAPLDKRSRFGSQPVPDEELRAVVSAAVHTFVQAFAADARGAR